MIAAAPSVLHIVDSLAIGGTQAILKDYFESRPGDRSIFLHGLRAVPQPMRVLHENVRSSSSANRFSIAPLLDMKRVVARQAIGILHCHLFRAQVFGYLLKELFFPRITLVFHEHGRVVGQEGETALETFVFRRFLQLARPRVDRYICISEHTRECLLRIVPAAAGKTVVVPNPIPVRPRAGDAASREATRRELGVPEAAFVVGFASRLVERKGWEDFLGAMARLPSEIPAYFLLAGDGEDKPRVESRIRELGLAGRGRTLGHIDWMRRFYACLDCFVMPSHWEPHGLAHLEAQSFGVPTILTDVPGMRSTVRGDVDALLFPPGDAAALAECIRRIATDPALRSRLAAEGRANAARYTMEAFAASLHEVYAGAAPAADSGSIEGE